ncbi:MAG TPA: chitinase [Solirubrobacteraceae bacterium]|nr:chitinase [Solirubrobacteraceae bacterium]
MTPSRPGIARAASRTREALGRPAGALAALCCCAWLAVAFAPGASAAVLTAAPYEYMGWGSPQPPDEVLSATGLHDLTLAFVLSHKRCNPEWDGERPLLGGTDQLAIEQIRAAGGDVAVSFGGWSGRKLGTVCRTPAQLAGAYQTVIGAYALKSIDIDIEHAELSSAKTRTKVAQALAIVQAQDPGLEISITMPTGPAGPQRSEQSLIADAAAAGLHPSAWTVMPFDFGVAESNMGRTSIEAVEGLANDLQAAYGVSQAEALHHAGISSMNGHTDEADESVSGEDFATMLAFAREKHLARLTFWSVNRDRECAGATQGEDECSGVSQAPYAYSDLIAQYSG